MPISIRRATPQDAQAIVEIIAAAFNEEANPAQIATLISEGEHLTFVAEDEKIVGFIDGFYTLGNWDLRRLELDLLAVHPEYSGKGIGKALIRKFTESEENTAFVRALVAVDNTPMHHAMRATGYRQDEYSTSLYIASEGIAAPSKYKQGIIPVKTFTYTGIWLEGGIDGPNKERIDAAHYLRQELGYSIVGKLISSHVMDAPQIEIIKNAGFEFVKQFHWWSYETMPNTDFFSHLIKWGEIHGD